MSLQARPVGTLSALPLEPPPSPARWTSSAEAPTDDAALVARTRTGDEVAFEHMFRMYYAPLCAFVARCLRGREVAEEVVQDLFCGIWAGRTNWDVRGSLRSYLYTAARNRALRRLKRNAIETRWETAAAAAVDAGELAIGGMGAASVSPETRFETQEIERALARAIDALPPRRREAYLLRWQHQMSYADIARVMGISIKGVDVALTKAHRAVRQALGHLID